MSGDGSTEEGDADAAATTIRVATFNASLSRDTRGQLAEDLKGGEDPQARKVAEILQRVRPDVVLLNEFDWDSEGRAARIFAEQYLSVGQGGAEALDYPHRYVPETNTGVHSGVDLDNNGSADDSPGDPSYGNDAFGFGVFPGQYGMAIFSRYPIDEQAIRTFRKFRWTDMPEHLMPEDFYSSQAVDVLRLSSKNHVDVPVEIDGRTLHLLASHPTPPSFDGEADRNGRRNHDEIRFWSDYVAGGERAGYIRDDSGTQGGLASGASFVVLGDLNSDPKDGDSRHAAIRNLLEHPRIQDPRPTSTGAQRAAETQGDVNSSHEGDSGLDTADFGDNRVGNLRVDYALPSADLAVRDTSVFWPAPDAEHADLTDVSDHRLVWVDVGISTRR